MNGSGSNNETWGGEAETVAESEMSLVGNELGKRRRRSKRKINGLGTDSKDANECQRFSQLNADSSEIFSEGKSSVDGEERLGDGKEQGRSQRLRCRQHELNAFQSEIDRRDVMESCDRTSYSAGREEEEEEKTENRSGPRRDCPGNRSSRSTCSEGSYSRRKHHKHKQKNKSQSRLSESPAVSPKVNPIFLWVRQEDTTIMEVLCEDYDYRNRLKLRRTHLGWRAIPKTKCFTEATAEEEDDKIGRLNKPKKMKKLKKKKKKKKTKKTMKRDKDKSSKKLKKSLQDNPNLIKECSVALYRSDLMLEKLETTKSRQKDTYEDVSIEETVQEANETVVERFPSPEATMAEDANVDIKPGRALTKSNSCEFSSHSRIKENIPRSISLDFSQIRSVGDWKLEVKEEGEGVNVAGKSESADEIQQDGEKQNENCYREDDFVGINADEPKDKKNHSENIVVDMTKHDSDFNDADCDELGQLLKVIPDLEFVVEEDLEEVDEDEWSTPTDLTLPKTPLPAKNADGQLSQLPVNISPVVTVTSTVRPPEPLTAPLPEVTITPIPKPAHQPKPKNNFLENLLSSGQNVKPELEERVESRKPILLDSSDRKSSKHFHEADSDSEVKSKRLNCEDITLKSLLSKQSVGKSADPKKCVSTNMDECPKSRLHDLLSEKSRSDPMSELKEVLSNPLLPVPDPLLVPRARLPALVASPASEIPRLLTINMEKNLEKRTTPPIMDSDVLEVSLSNLQTLLSSNPEKLGSPNSQDLANYQKSLETFLDWQRYQTQLMEKQLTNPRGLLPSGGFTNDVTDMAAATAFGQMLWLPYLSQFDVNANQNIMSMMCSMFNGDTKANSTKLSAPPQIHISQVPQPSPFLTPTSPMEIESHLKTLAMWQEAIVMQQTSQVSRTCSKVPTGNDSRRSTKTQYNSSSKKQFIGAHQQNIYGTPTSSRGESLFDEYQKRPKLSFEQKSGEHQRHIEAQPKYRHEPQFHLKKGFRNLGCQQPSEWQKNSRSNDKKRHPSGSISVKPLSNLLERNSRHYDKSWDQLESEKQKCAEFTDHIALRLQQFNTQIQKTKVKNEDAVEKQETQSPVVTPKLKVKNLVDPNMSPPQLLKQMAPEHLPPIAMDEPETIQEEGQSNVWHPLFGR